MFVELQYEITTVSTARACIHFSSKYDSEREHGEWLQDEQKGTGQGGIYATTPTR